jgi:hypothetical protein
MAIQFVGGATAGKAGATSGNTTIALNSGLTGGIASAVSAGDLVIAVFGTGSTADRTLAITDGTTNYTLIGTELYANDTFDTNLRVAYKFMGGTPDTATTFGPTGSANDAGAMAVYVFRGVDSTTPLDVSAATTTIINSLLVVPPDVTPSTAGAFPVVAGAAAHNGGVDTFTSSDLTDFRTQGGTNDTNDVTIGIGHQDNWTSGATNYATWGCTQATSNTYSCAAVTFVLRPAAAVPITGSGSLSAQVSDVSGTGLTRSLGTGALAAQAADVSGSGLSRSLGTGALAAQASDVSGAGKSRSLGTGALAAQSAVIVGAGTVSGGAITGTGALVAQSATLSGAGKSRSLGTGALSAQAVTLIGAGKSRSLGAGALAAQSATVEGEGTVPVSGITGTGALAAQSATVVGVGLVKGRARNCFNTPWGLPW